MVNRTGTYFGFDGLGQADPQSQTSSTTQL